MVCSTCIIKSFTDFIKVAFGVFSEEFDLVLQNENSKASINEKYDNSFDNFEDYTEVSFLFIIFVYFNNNFYFEPVKSVVFV